MDEQNLQLKSCLSIFNTLLLSRCALHCRLKAVGNHPRDKARKRALLMIPGKLTRSNRATHDLEHSSKVWELLHCT